jgi:CheY-like chemotaxis protein
MASPSLFPQTQSLKPRAMSMRPRVMSMRPTSGTEASAISGVVVTVRRHVLVIDDDEMVRRACVRALRRRYTITELRDAESALSLIRSGTRFDAILCDLNLDGMSGRELLMQLRLLHPDQARRTIIVSGSPRNSMDEHLLEAVETRYIEKPAPLSMIENVISDVIRSTEEDAAKATLNEAGVIRAA